MYSYFFEKRSITYAVVIVIYVVGILAIQCQQSKVVYLFISSHIYLYLSHTLIDTHRVPITVCLFRGVCGVSFFSEQSTVYIIMIYMYV